MVLQGDLQDFQQLTGLVEVRTPDVHRAATLLGDAVAQVVDGGLLVARDDPAALNSELVTAGVRVAALHAQRRSLEAAVLDATTDSSDKMVAR